MVLNEYKFPEYSGIPYETQEAGTSRDPGTHIVGVDDQSEQKSGSFFFLYWVHLQPSSGPLYLGLCPILCLE